MRRLASEDGAAVREFGAVPRVPRRQRSLSQTSVPFVKLHLRSALSGQPSFPQQDGWSTTAGNTALVFFSGRCSIQDPTRTSLPPLGRNRMTRGAVRARAFQVRPVRFVIGEPSLPRLRGFRSVMSNRSRGAVAATCASVSGGLCIGGGCFSSASANCRFRISYSSAARRCSSRLCITRRFTNQSAMLLSSNPTGLSTLRLRNTLWARSPKKWRTSSGVASGTIWRASLQSRRKALSSSSM